MSGVTGGFAWHEPYARALTRARWLFAIAVAVLALYVTAFAALVALGIDLGEIGPWRAIDDAADAARPLGVAGVLLGAYLVVAVLVAVFGRRGTSTSTLRRLGVRRPTDSELDHASSFIDAFALARGIPSPRLAIVD